MIVPPHYEENTLLAFSHLQNHETQPPRFQVRERSDVSSIRGCSRPVQQYCIANRLENRLRPERRRAAAPEDGRTPKRTHSPVLKCMSTGTLRRKSQHLFQSLM